MPAGGKKSLVTWAEHRERYRKGCGSDHCKTARNVCLARGSVPCDVLFVGEAPGFRENDLGVPFVGPAGQLLDEMVAEALGEILLCTGTGRYVEHCPMNCPHEDRRPRVAFTNVVGCIPLQDGGDKFKEPDYGQVLDCSGRLAEFVALANPRLLVACGKVAYDAFDPKYKGSVPFPNGCKLISVHHPAYILRANAAQQGLLRRKWVVTVSNAAGEL